MSELSVFIDESGDFGSYEHHAPYYIITLVFHDQSSDISEQIKHLRRHLVEQGFAENHAIHSAPLIRRERDYSGMDLTARRKLFRSLFTFMRLCDISYKSFTFKKRESGRYHHQTAACSRRRTCSAPSRSSRRSLRTKG